MAHVWVWVIIVLVVWLGSLGLGSRAGVCAKMGIIRLGGMCVVGVGIGVGLVAVGGAWGVMLGSGGCYKVGIVSVGRGGMMMG